MLDHGPHPPRSREKKRNPWRQHVHRATRSRSYAIWHKQSYHVKSIICYLCFMQHAWSCYFFPLQTSNLKLNFTSFCYVKLKKKRLLFSRSDCRSILYKSVCLHSMQFFPYQRDRDYVTEDLRIPSRDNLIPKPYSTIKFSTDMQRFLYYWGLPRGLNKDYSMDRFLCGRVTEERPNVIITLWYSNLLGLLDF